MKNLMNLMMYILATMMLISFSQCSKDGPQGPEGERGERGERGKQGDKGAKGDDGTSILSGKGAPSSSLGNAGDFYLDLSSSELYGPKTASGWGTAVSIQGEKGGKGDKGSKGDKGATGAKGDKGDKGTTGAKGQDGSQFLSGTAVPSSSLGNVGDFYFRTSTSVLYGPKTSAGWGSGTSLRGPKGDKGDKGDPGNANVKKYTFSVRSNEWTGALHFGGSNTHVYFKVESSMTGGISLFNSDYVVLAYARTSGVNYNEKKQLPYTFGIDNNYGIKFELLPSRSYIIMSKTVNGWDSSSLPLAERPDKVDFEIVMIGTELISKLQNKLDFSNYNAVAKHFNLD